MILIPTTTVPIFRASMAHSDVPDRFVTVSPRGKPLETDTLIRHGKYFLLPRGMCVPARSVITGDKIDFIPWDEEGNEIFLLPNSPISLSRKVLVHNEAAKYSVSIAYGLFTPLLRVGDLFFWVKNERRDLTEMI